MEIKYNVSGKERKNLVNTISSITGVPVKYLGAPTFNYEADYFTIDRAGMLSFDDRTDSSEIELLIERLAEKGFEAEVVVIEEDPERAADAPTKADSAKVDGLVICMPKDMFTEEAISNLNRLVEAKGELIKKALAADELLIVREEERICFPWFSGTPDGDTTQAYASFITAICEIAIKQKRVSVTPKEVINDKYAFRCFLLRLGFIGDEYKKQRKILLQNLDGSSAFKNGAMQGGVEK